MTPCKCCAAAQVPHLRNPPLPISPALNQPTARFFQFFSKQSSASPPDLTQAHPGGSGIGGECRAADGWGGPGRGNPHAVPASSFITAGSLHAEFRSQAERAPPMPEPPGCACHRTINKTRRRRRRKAKEKQKIRSAPALTYRSRRRNTSPSHRSCSWHRRTPSAYSARNKVHSQYRQSPRSSSACSPAPFLPYPRQ